VRPPQGFSSEEVAATVILVSSHYGYPLSTTHVVSGAVTGSGVGRPGAQVDWAVAGRIVTGWVLTLPAAAGTAAIVYGFASIFGHSWVGPAAITVILAIACFFLWKANKASKVDPEGIIDEASARNLEAVHA
jgi:PiT family inorganic phosphate transporter